MIPLSIIAIIAQMADVATTALFLSRGYAELNPLVGPDPDIWLLIVIKLTVITAIVFLCHGRSRNWLLGVAAVIGFGAAGWNLFVVSGA